MLYLSVIRLEVYFLLFDRHMPEVSVTKNIKSNWKQKKESSLQEKKNQTKFVNRMKITRFWYGGCRTYCPSCCPCTV